jgi:AAA family ATP:ADP antiporter
MLADVRDDSFAADLDKLLDHPSDEVKKRALANLRALDASPDPSRIESLVSHVDPDVRLAAMRFATRSGDGTEERLREYMDSGDARVASTGLRCAAEQAPGLVTRPRVDALLGRDGDASARIEVARALGELADPACADVLRKLAGDDSPAVAGAAVEAMGATREREFVVELVEMLADSGLRKHARTALVQYGNGVVGTLGDYLADDYIDISIRRNVPAVLSRIPTQQSADALAASLDNVDASLRFRVVKALNKLRANYPDLVIEQNRVDEAFVEETRMYYEIMQVTTVCRGRLDSPAGALLSRALEERLEHNLERIFRVLGLHYPPNDIYNAYLGIVSSDRDRRASAVEFLDNVLGQNLKKYLFPIIDRVSDAVTIERGRDLFGVEITDAEAAMLLLIRGRDPWLRACAIYCCAGRADGEIRRAVEEARKDPDPLVRETADLVLRSGPSSQE